MTNADQGSLIQLLLSMAATGRVTPGVSADSVAAAFQAGVKTGLERILPPALAAVGSNMESDLPQWLLAAVRQQLVNPLGHRIVQDHWLQQFLANSKARDFPVVLLKNAAFAGTLYDESHPRLSADLDLLVTEHDFARACRLFDTMGRKGRSTETRHSSAASAFETSYEIIHMGVPVTVELHRNLTWPHLFNVEARDLWDSSLQCPRFSHESVRILSPENTLLHLAVHDFRHCSRQPHTLVDAARVIRIWNLSCEKLFSSATGWGARAVLFGLLDDLRRLGVSLSSELIERLDPGAPKRFLLHFLFPFDFSSHGSSHMRIRQLLSLGLLDTPGNLARFAVYYGRLRLADLLRAARPDDERQ